MLGLLHLHLLHLLHHHLLLVLKLHLLGRLSEATHAFQSSILSSLWHLSRVVVVQVQHVVDCTLLCLTLHLRLHWHMLLQRHLRLLLLSEREGRRL